MESVDNAGFDISNPMTNGALSSSDASITLSAKGIDALSGSKGTSLTQDSLGTIASGFNTTAYKGSKTYYTTAGKPVHYEFTFDSTNFKSDNRSASYGDTLTAYFTAKLVDGVATSTSSDSSWIA